MTLDNLITLITAGFTKEEILTMTATATQRAPQPQPQPQPQAQAQAQVFPQAYGYAPMPGSTVAGQNGGAFRGQNGVAGTVGGPTPGVTPGVYGGVDIHPKSTQGYNVDVVNELRRLTSAVQLGNVNAIGTIPAKKETTEDVIANIINPNYEGLEGEGTNGK